MPIIYKINVLVALKEKGYTQNRIREEKLIGQSYLTQLRHSELVSWKTLETICRLLECQPGDLLEYVEEDKYANLGLTKGEMPEFRKLVELIPDSKVDEILPSLIDLIREDDWYDLCDDERRKRLKEVVLKYNP